MNQDQRKYLITQVEQTCKNQVADIEAEIPKKPSLNNYLVAAFLDDSIQFADIKELKVKIRKRVLAMSKNDVLIEETENWRNQKSSQSLSLDPADLFIIPDNYKKALAEYQMKKAKIQEQVKQIEAHRNTIIMKIQIGSNEVLDKLVTQVDNMADLNIMNNQFLIAELPKKSLGDGKKKRG